MKDAVKSECGGGCNHCGHCGTSHAEGCQGGCQGCESSQEMFCIDEYGEMDDRGFPLKLVVIDITEKHVFFDELKKSLESKGYEVLVESLDIKEEQKQYLVFCCNGELIRIEKAGIENAEHRVEEIKKLEQHIAAPMRNRY